MKLNLRWHIGIALVAVLLLLLSTQYVLAQTDAKIADTQCGPEKGMCAYQQLCDKTKPKTPENTGILGKACKDPHGVDGTCTAYQVCKATTAKTSTGSSMKGAALSQLMSAISQLMKGLGGGGGSPPPPPSTPTTGTAQGCTQYYSVSVPSSDPCSYYVPPASSGINIDTGSNPNTNLNTIGNSSDTSNPINDLISTLLGGGTNGTTGNDTATGANSSASSGDNNVGGISSSTAQGVAGITDGSGVTGVNGGHGGATGDIRVLPNGATIVITNLNAQGNSFIAGFLGTQATGGIQPTGIAASWCRTRPWASNFLSFIIPPTFFDNLCSLRGFQVGEMVQGAGPAQIGTHVTLTQDFSTSPTATTTGAYQNVPTSPPMQADIWANPAAVPLGGRTTIYWNSKNAASCIETSPDGSFSHTSLSGGGATVPLSGATTFTISCTAPDGTHATHDVVVNLSL